MISKCTIMVILCNFCMQGETQDLSFRIWKGKAINIEDAPHSVAIEVDKNYKCSGSILTEDVILTAAHCIIDLTPENEVKIRAGSTSILTGGTVAGIRDYLIHHENDYEGMQNDIGLVWLDQKLSFNDSKIQPVRKLANQDEPDLPEGTIAFVTGWGMMENKTYPEMLRGVKQPIIDSKKCKHWAKQLQEFEFSDRMICAGYFGGDSSTCSGDSGSGLLVNGKLVGVTSLGYVPCGEEVGVYVKVASYRNWIDYNIKNHDPL